jgi:hypothetical protein
MYFLKKEDIDEISMLNNDERLQFVDSLVSGYTEDNRTSSISKRVMFILDRVTIKQDGFDKGYTRQQAVEVAKAFNSLFNNTYKKVGLTMSIDDNTLGVDIFVNLMEKEHITLEQFRLIFLFLSKDKFWGCRIVSPESLQRHARRLVVLAKSNNGITDETLHDIVSQKFLKK